MNDSFSISKEYKTEYYKDPTGKALLYLVSFLTFIALFIWIMRIFISRGNVNSKPLILFISIAIFILFIRLLINLRKNLVRKALLNFDEVGFGIVIYELNSDVVISKDYFLWQDISAYKFYLDTKNNTCLTLYLNNKKKREFIFKDNKTYEQAISQDSVFSNFYSYVKEYNQGEQKILPRASWLATNTGKYIILAETLLLVIALVLHFINNNFSHAYYLMIGAGLLIPQILNRSQNLAMYNKISKLDH